ncbi:hypothetical protein [Spiroplasma alleghenense]|uniref:Uncharacterized protein n=1 Tax=Spiroplasma alleghenense TaxID=216931 RepID=A0A345Z324_9MOLU|nr:hypothetical protein [Spiroplasma alleghenense]AXK51003.1 hypothetical protein SALLE_v1c03290 [Spiroplasma alleghenense]
MRVITKKIVTTMFLLVLYFIYSAFLKEFQESNSVLFSLFDPFKLLILAFIFGIIVSTFNSIFLGWIKNISTYQKNRNSYLLTDFDQTIEGLKKAQVFLKSNKISELKNQLALLNKLTYRPIFMSVLINDLIKEIIAQKDLSSFEILIDKCILQISEIKSIEENRLQEHKKQALFDFKRSYEYNSQGSKFYIDYYENKQELNIKTKRSEWNLLALQMLRFYPILIFSVLISLIACMLFAPLAIFVIKKDIFIILATAFVFCSTCVAIIWHSIYLFKNKNSKILFKKAIIFYTILIIMALNLVWCFFNIKNSLSNNIATDSQERLFNFLFEILYCVLSTALLAYVFTTLIELFRDVYLNKIILWEGIIIPSVVFLTISLVNLLNIAVFNSAVTFNVNLLIMSIYWVSVWFMTPILKF